MGYTVEELQNLKNPYKHLGNGDALAEHREELNSMHLEAKRNLASRMILKCPPGDLKTFHGAIEASRTPHDNKEAFNSILAEAYEVKNRIIALLDPRNKKPHLMILGNEFDEELFNNNKQLAQDVLQDNETAIAERLALTTPKEDRSQLAVNVKSIFPDSELAKKIGHAFAIRHDMEHFLLGDDPHEFFASREYNIDACHEFAGLFTLVAGQESSIAAKLALSTPDKKRSSILQNIRSLAVPSNNELASAIGRAFELRRSIDILLGNEPEQFFSRGFSADLCNEFAMLFPILLQGKEESIGEKLSLVDAKTRAEINRKLEIINCAAHEKTCPFRTIAAAMATQPEDTQKSDTTAEISSPKPVASSSGTNPNSLFNSSNSGPAQRRSLLKTPTVQDSDPEKDEDTTEKSKESSCYKSFCGMF